MARILVILTSVTLFAVNPLIAVEKTPTAEDVRDLMEHQPLTLDTWPKWREYYVSLYYVTDAREPQEFYEKLYEFIGNVTSQNGGTLSGEFENDPVAWGIFARYLSRQAIHDFPACERAAEKAITLGDPMGMSSHALTYVLIYHYPHFDQSDKKEITAESRQKLAKAEELLLEVERAAPLAKLSFSRGLITAIRGEIETAIPLLKQATLENPYNADIAATYLSYWLIKNDSTQPSAKTTEPFATKFPASARILSMHAVALFGDGQFQEAYQTWHHASELNQSGEKLLGKETIESLENGKWLTPNVMNGIDLSKKGLHYEAAREFRSALQQDGNNIRFVASFCG